MPTKEVRVGNERFVYTEGARTLPTAITGELIGLLGLWTACMPYEPTFVMREYGVPSLIARFDCIVDEDGLQVYEIQGGCSWIGYAGAVNPAFRAIRDELVRTVWPQIQLLAPPAIRGDDELWLERVTLEQALASTSALMIRKWLFRELPHEQRMALVSRAIKPMFDQNDKRYGIELGWWREVSSLDPLPWHESFVLKPRQGDGSSDIMIWNPADRKGRSTRTQILNSMSRHNIMYLQRFIPPMEISLGEQRYNMLYRPFFGYHPYKRTWIPMHGVWTARPYPNLRLHGASDAISGPLMVE